MMRNMDFTRRSNGQAFRIYHSYTKGARHPDLSLRAILRSQF